jgi:hypothetical protein
MRTRLTGRYLLAWCVVAIAPATAARAQPAGAPTIREDRVVAGSDKDFMEVRHLVLKGSNEAIGRTLGEIARERHHVSLLPGQDPLRVRAQRHYFEKNFPILFERMRGVAGAYGKRLEDDAWNFSWLDYGHFSAGCSVIHFPPSLMADGTSLVSRDYDFSTGTMLGTRPAPGELAATTRPYVLEIYPDQGYASLAICSYDMLSGVLDGINSEGLTVAILADDELTQKFKTEQAGPTPVGLGSLQAVRLLLDTCATVEEAKEALLLNKQVYEFVPVHYLVADRHGKSFVWEYSQAHNREYILRNPNRPLITTNFSLHRHLEGGKLPTAKGAEKICPRYCLLSDRLNGHEGKLTTDFIKETHKKVDAAFPALPGSSRAPNRTLWHALYYPEQRKVQVNFYLRDEPDPDRPGKTRIVRSDYVDFCVDPSKAR